jgi:hypothetical protein
LTDVELISSPRRTLGFDLNRPNTLNIPYFCGHIVLLMQSNSQAPALPHSNLSYHPIIVADNMTRDSRA